MQRSSELMAPKSTEAFSVGVMPMSVSPLMRQARQSVRGCDGVSTAATNESPLTGLVPFFLLILSLLRTADYQVKDAIDHLRRISLTTYETVRILSRIRSERHDHRQTDAA